jgi:hypothetical protein
MFVCAVLQAYFEAMWWVWYDLGRNFISVIVAVLIYYNASATILACMLKCL